MSNASRMVRRRQWREDCPPQFRIGQKRDAAAALGGKLAPRRSFRLWCLEKLNPKLYASLVQRALDRATAAGTAVKNADGDVLVTEDKLGVIELNVEAIAKRLDKSHEVVL